MYYLNNLFEQNLVRRLICEKRNCKTLPQVTTNTGLVQSIHYLNSENGFVSIC